MKNTWIGKKEDGSDKYYPDFVRDHFKVEGFNPLAHAAMGIAGEAGELLDAIKKHVIYGKELDVVNVREELGDLMFYMTALMNELKISEWLCITENVEKLKKRYPEGYSDEAAIERADKKESGLKADTYFAVCKNKQERDSKSYIDYFDSEEEAKNYIESCKRGERSEIIYSPDFCIAEVHYDMWNNWVPF